MDIEVTCARACDTKFASLAASQGPLILVLPSESDERIRTHAHTHTNTHTPTHRDTDTAKTHT